MCTDMPWPNSVGAFLTIAVVHMCRNTSGPHGARGDPDPDPDPDPGARGELDSETEARGELPPRRKAAMSLVGSSRLLVERRSPPPRVDGGGGGAMLPSLGTRLCDSKRHARQPTRRGGEGGGDGVGPRC